MVIPHLLSFSLSFPAVDHATPHGPFGVKTSDQHLFHHWTLTLFVLPWQQTCWISNVWSGMCIMHDVYYQVGPCITSDFNFRVSWQVKTLEYQCMWWAVSPTYRDADTQDDGGRSTNDKQRSRVVYWWTTGRKRWNKRRDGRAKKREPETEWAKLRSHIPKRPNQTQASTQWVIFFCSIQLQYSNCL